MAASFGFRNMGRSGAILERNVKDAWWRKAVDMRDDIVAFDSSIVIHQSTLILRGTSRAFGPTISLGSRRCPDCGMKETLTEPRAFASLKSRSRFASK